jgi:hypothetical protein
MGQRTTGPGERRNSVGLVSRHYGEHVPGQADVWSQKNVRTPGRSAAYPGRTNVCTSLEPARARGDACTRRESRKSLTGRERGRNQVSCSHLRARPRAPSERGTGQKRGTSLIKWNPAEDSGFPPCSPQRASPDRCPAVALSASRQHHRPSITPSDRRAPDAAPAQAPRTACSISRATASRSGARVQRKGPECSH